jgi:GT2 family glycosyltransferase
MRQDSLITVAIPTLMGGALLASCLDALNAQIFRDFDVIVINNGTTGMQHRSLASSHWRILSPGYNAGFGAAINLAIRASSSPYIATLNDDAEPHPEWLLSLARETAADPSVGMWASRIRMRGTSALDSAGMMICFDGSSKQRGHSQLASDYDCSQDVLFPSACAALYSRRMLDEIGLFDEDYFLYCEDTDLGLRARWAGWTCQYVSDAVVEHRYSSTAGAFSAQKAGFVERNRLWVALKNFPVALLFGVPFVTVSRYFWQLRAARGSTGAAAAFFRSGNSLFTAFAILARAHAETLLRLPSLLRKRHRMRKTRRVGSTEFSRLLARYRISAKDLARA